MLSSIWINLPLDLFVLVINVGITLVLHPNIKLLSCSFLVSEELAGMGVWWTAYMDWVQKRDIWWWQQLYIFVALFTTLNYYWAIIYNCRCIHGWGLKYYTVSWLYMLNIVKVLDMTSTLCNIIIEIWMNSGVDCIESILSLELSSYSIIIGIFNGCIGGYSILFYLLI